ncbi:MAG TPA: YhjD/YihY/BrkB family envelope integrity protein [Acidimicrobiales bacterium]|nr:YhjD/YihY/BrkB family envelope integrity protein [Acidimicrobiales bacterium]
MGSPSPSRVADRARPVTDEGSPTEGGRVTRLLEAVDGFQQRHVVLALPFAVQKKYGEDKGGVLTTNLAFAMFTTAFPLLLVLVTVLDLVLAGNPSARAQVLHTAYGQFPIVGKTLAADIHPLQRSSIVGLVVGLAALLYGATSLAGSGQYVMAQVWELAPADQPGFVARLGHRLLFLVLLALGLGASTVLSGLSTFGAHDVVLGWLSLAAAAVLDACAVLAAFRVLTPRRVPTRSLVVGAVVGGVAFAALQALGGYVVGHDLRRASAEYGMFALVLGLLAWLVLVAKVVVYASELNTVLAGHLWPRGLHQPPLTSADRAAMALEAGKARQRPEQVVCTRFVDRVGAEDASHGRPRVHGPGHGDGLGGAA